MRTPEEKAEMVRQQVISKIHWGTRDQEVLDWLWKHHKITGDDADALLEAAHRKKRMAVRGKAIFTLIGSSLGIAFAGGFVALQYFGRFIMIGYGPFVILGIGLISLGAFLRSLMLLLTGRAEGSVE